MSHLLWLRRLPLVLLLYLVVGQAQTVEASCGDYLHRETRTSTDSTEPQPPGLPGPCSGGRCQKTPAQPPVVPDRLRLTSLGEPFLSAIRSRTPVAPGSGRWIATSQDEAAAAGYPLRIERPPRF